MDAVTLDQLRVFLAIVEEGSFASAAKRLARAQSAITYAVQKLEDQSGVLLFDRGSYRPTLTAAGRSLLPYAKRVIADMAAYRVQAQTMAAGVEAQIVLALPEPMPPRLLVETLGAFKATFPSVRLVMTTPGQANAIAGLAAGRIDLAVLMDIEGLPDWLERSRCGTLALIAVASPSHPLSAIEGPIAEEDFGDHLQIVVTGLMGSDAPDYGVMAANRWDVTGHGIKRDLLRAGIGWGSMPADLVTDDLETGRLVKLTPVRWSGADQMPQVPILIGYNRQNALGPAARELVALFSRSTRDAGAPATD